MGICGVFTYNVDCHMVVLVVRRAMVVPFPLGGRSSEWKLLCLD